MKTPHILFILTDQLRADCLGCVGHKIVKTPHIDHLAAEGVRFTNCFTTSSLCVPARISMTAGLYPHNTNLWQNDATVPLDSDTIAKGLKKRGYQTATIGKNHLFPISHHNLYENEKGLHDIGFDHAEDFTGTWDVMTSRSIYSDYLENLNLLEPLRKYLKNLESKPDEVRRFIAEPLPINAEHYIDAFIPQRVERYIETYNSDQPSFLFVGFQGPHEPWDGPDKYYQMYDLDKIPDPIPELPPGEWLSERSCRYQQWAQYYQPKDPRDLKKVAARYFAKITQIDDSIGEILKVYKRKGWLDSTVVIFASDHGEMLGDLGRLSKSVVYDSAVRVPLIIRMPDGIGASKTIDSFVETIDIHGTILDIADCEIFQNKDCLSLMPLVQGNVKYVREDVLSEVHAHYMLRTKDWKLVIGRDGLALQLFDLKNDSLEQKNLCGHPDYRLQELEMRSRLLTRITKNTLRIGKWDPEFSSRN